MLPGRFVFTFLAVGIVVDEPTPWAALLDVRDGVSEFVEHDLLNVLAEWSVEMDVRLLGRDVDRAKQPGPGVKVYHSSGRIAFRQTS